MPSNCKISQFTFTSLVMLLLALSFQVIEELVEEIDTGLSQNAYNCALKQVGKPYVAGAAGPNSFDCSGLVQYCYKQAGKSIPRVSGDQCSGKAKRTSSPVQGNIVCFSGHVGLYKAPDLMIHSPHPGKNVGESHISWEKKSFFYVSYE